MPYLLSRIDYVTLTANSSNAMYVRLFRHTHRPEWIGHDSGLVHDVPVSAVAGSKAVPGFAHGSTQRVLPWI